MKKYKYRARKNPEETVEGVLLADSRDEVVDQINELGLLPIEINEERLVERTKSAPWRFLIKKASARDLAVFYGQLSRLVKSGVPILRALGIIREQTENDYFAEIL